MIYTILYFVIFIPSFLFTVGKNEIMKAHERYLYIVLSVALLLMAGLRYNVGYDFMAYENLFDKISNTQEGIWSLSQGLNVELGFVFLCKICANYSIFIFAVACLAIIPKLIYMYKECEFKLAVLLMYYCGLFMTYDMGVMRQGLSISIAIYGLKYIQKRNLAKFLIVIFAATLFHVSSLIFIPLYFIGCKEFSRKVYYTTAILAIAFSFYSDNSFLLSLIQNIPQGGIISDKAAYYALNYNTEESLVISILKRCVFLVIFVEFFKRMKVQLNDRKQVIYLNGYYLSIVFASLFASIPVIGGRGNAGLYFLQIFIFSKMLGFTKDKFTRTIMMLIIASLFFYTLIGPINDIYNAYLPYKTIFD